MRSIKLLTGAIASARDWASGGHRTIPRRPEDGTSSLTYGEVRRAAVALHGPGTKVRIWHDGSGHILPPPPYREEENLYGFEHEFQLRRQLPSLGTMTMEEWYAAKGERVWWKMAEEGYQPAPRRAPKPPAVVRTEPKPPAVVRTERTKAKKGRRTLAVGDRVLRADGQPGEGAVTAVWDSGHLVVEWDDGADGRGGLLYGPTGLVPAPGPKAGKAGKAGGKAACCGRCAEYPADTWDVCVCGCGGCDCPPDTMFAVGDRVRHRDGQRGKDDRRVGGRVEECRTGELCGDTVLVRWDGGPVHESDGEYVRESWMSVRALEPA